MALNPSRIAGIYRESVFSPGKIQADAAILENAVAALGPGWLARSILRAPETLEAFGSFPPPFALIMAQSERALELLEKWEQSGTRVVNSVRAVRNCYRRPLIRILIEAGIPIPTSEMVSPQEVKKISLRLASGPIWLKRGDVHAVQAADVVKVSSPAELLPALDHFRGQGIAEVLVQEHIPGEVVKFYGVGPGEYFSAFPSSQAPVPEPLMTELASLAARAAQAVGLEIFGGDAVLAEGGRVILIDLNDWPSFSRCRQEAAGSIARYITRILEGESHELPGVV